MLKRRTSTLRMIAATALLGLAIAFPCSAQSTPPRLGNVTKVTTLVLYNATGSTPYGISEERLRTVLELRLRSAGLRVLTDAEDAVDPDSNPYVMLDVSSLETSNQSGRTTGFAYKAALSVRLFGYVSINGTRAPLELWFDGTMGVGPNNEAGPAIERIVNQLADSMINRWLKDNPKR